MALATTTLPLALGTAFPQFAPELLCDKNGKAPIERISNTMGIPTPPWLSLGKEACQDYQTEQIQQQKEKKGSPIDPDMLKLHNLK